MVEPVYNEFKELRKVLNGKAISAANGAGLELELPNEGFTPPDNAVYGQFWFKTGATGQVELGGAGSWECTVGIFQFNVYAPAMQGDGPAVDTAGMLRKQFNRKEWVVPPHGNLKIVKANVYTPYDGPQNNKYLAIMDGTFHFYHRDPNADSSFN